MTDCKLHTTSYNEISARKLLPAAYREAASACELAKRLAAQRGTSMVLLPFDSCMEAEMLGMPLLGYDDSLGLRPHKEAVKLPKTAALTIFFKEPYYARFDTMCEAASLLEKDGLDTAFKVSGFVSLWDMLLDVNDFYTTWQTEPETLTDFFTLAREFCKQNILRAYSMGIRYFSFAEPLIHRDLVGNDFLARYGEEVLLPFFLDLQKLILEDIRFILCPRLGSNLVNLGLLQKAICNTKTVIYTSPCLEQSQSFGGLEKLILARKSF